MFCSCKFVREVKNDICEGILPMRLLLCKFRRCKAVKADICVGSVFVDELPYKFSVIKLVIFEIVVEIVLVMLLLYRFIVFSLASLDALVGIFPPSKLFDRSKIFNDVKVFIAVPGKLPVILLLRRSRIVYPVKTDKSEDNLPASPQFAVNCNEFTFPLLSQPTPDQGTAFVPQG